jgi:hypothetical protein
VRIKILGAGSAGMHHAHAARELGWDAEIWDIDPEALGRMPDIYRERYGEPFKNTSFDVADLTVIATPPETHIELASNQTGRVLIEKPLCAPGQLEKAKQLLDKDVFVGYGHALKAEPQENLEGLIGQWCEHWKYILAAHPWIKDQHDTYLGDPKRGGGPLGEHSHGLHMWQHMAREAGKGEVAKVFAAINDNVAVMFLITESGFTGFVTQDVIAEEPIKFVGGQSFGKHDFKAVLEHVATADPKTSPLSLEKGLRTAAVIDAAYKSARRGITCVVPDIHS